MSEIERSVNYAKKRSQALRNCESHLQTILFDVAKKIVSASKKYRKGGRLRNESSFLSGAKNIAATASNDIESYTGAYAKASCKILGIDTDNIGSFLVGDIYGKTLNERNTTYLSNFAEDIVRMVKAGTMMGYNDQQILSSIRTGYKDPYKSSVVTKAQKKDINIATPSYGKGVFRNAYQNIVRNSKQVISIAWGQAEQEYGQEIGAIGFKVFRGSSYPCETCQNEVDAGVHSFRDPYPPFHVGCLCYTQFVFKDNKTK
jgi:hypothetical protein|nr:hypothetical protein [uncultured Prevotella sp.]DAV55076.1 MAG TPA: hypothetical protein [Caudoviricetes sp.]